MNIEVKKALSDGVRVIEQLQHPKNIHFIESVAELIASSFDEGRKVIIAGNGGSLCDAMHFAEELTGQFRSYRKALPAIALSEPGYLTCVANDMGFDQVFARGVEAYGKLEDIFVGLTTSGNSPNIINAFKVAEEMGLKTVAFLGKTGGALKGRADYELLIKDFKTSDRIQEAHMTAIHIIIERVEAYLFSPQLV